MGTAQGDRRRGGAVWRHGSALGGAGALAAVATLLQLGAERYLDFRSPFIFFYLAVLVSTLLWGWVAGAVTVGAGAIFGGVFVLNPRGLMPWGDPVEETELLLFACAAAFMVVLVEGLRRARVRADLSAGRAAAAAERLQDEVAVRKRAERELERHRDHLSDLVRERTAALEASHHRLRTSERMAAVGGLASGLAHDMANLILPMSVRLERLASVAGDESAEEVAALAQCVDYLRSLAHGLRLFSRDPSAGADEVTGVARWLGDSAPFFRNIVPSSISLQIEAAVTPDIRIPPHRLTQAVLNLIGNARDAIGGSTDGRITLRVRPEGPDRCRIDVTDNGCGMPEDLRRRCTEPYFTTKGPSGTGLGLALVTEIVRTAGGSIEIESAPGRGTRISLELRVAAVAAPRTFARTAVVSTGDARMTAVAEALLKSAGHSVVEPGSEADPEADIWVIDPVKVDRQRVADFLRGAAGRVVIAWGGTTDEVPGALSVPDRTPTALRRCLEQVTPNRPEERA